MVGRERGQPRVGHRDHTLTTLLEPHGRRSDLDLEPSVSGPDLQRLTWFQTEGLSE
jgi:hypothetical protein